MVGRINGHRTALFPLLLCAWKIDDLLAILCAVNVGVGYIFPDIPLTVTAYIDAAIKLGFGVYLFFFSKPTQQK